MANFWQKPHRTTRFAIHRVSAQADPRVEDSTQASRFAFRASHSPECSFSKKNLKKCVNLQFFKNN